LSAPATIQKFFEYVTRAKVGNAQKREAPKVQVYGASATPARENSTGDEDSEEEQGE
jgi:hypothetical protein